MEKSWPITPGEEASGLAIKVLENVKTMSRARTIAVDIRTHHLYLPAAEYNPVPAATTENPRPRHTMKPGSFVILDIAPVK